MGSLSIFHVTTTFLEKFVTPSVARIISIFI